MRYIKPHYYDQFTCIAGACPATCCAGWQIMIDEEALEHYENVQGDFGARLRNSIDWEEGCFCQYDRRCAFLNEQDLCDIYKELGADSLCTTCKMYPRHVEEYEGLREYSLSLSCPEAARIMLTCEEPVRFKEECTEEEEEAFDDMDILLFTQLEESRDLLFDILQDRSSDLQKRKKIVTELIWEIQCAIDEEEYFKVDEIIDKYKKKLNNLQLSIKTNKKGFLQKKEEFAWFRKLELLSEDWKYLLDDTEELLFSKGEEVYERDSQAFDAWLEQTDRMQEPLDRAVWDVMQEQLLMFFIYTYFCGAVYDNYIYAKAALAVFSADWIREFCLFRWLSKGKMLAAEDVIELSYRYAREVEHSDMNLEILIQELDAQSTDLC